jgi:hypothetical protein
MCRTNIFKGKLDFPDDSPGAKNYFKTFLKLLNFAFKNVVFILVSNLHKGKK